MARARVITGAAVVCYINGQQFGRVFGFSFKSLTPRKAIYGLDSVDPHELAPTQSRVTGTLRLYRTVADGGAEGAGMAANFEDLPREKYFTVQLVDRGTDKVLFQAQFCSAVSQSWDIPIKGIVTGTLEFEAITWSNEIRPLGVSG
jgi:hypothetical protein